MQRIDLMHPNFYSDEQCSKLALTLEAFSSDIKQDKEYILLNRDKSVFSDFSFSHAVLRVQPGKYYLYNDKQQFASGGDATLYEYKGTLKVDNNRLVFNESRKIQLIFVPSSRGILQYCDKKRVNYVVTPTDHVYRIDYCSPYQYAPEILHVKTLTQTEKKNMCKSYNVPIPLSLYPAKSFKCSKNMLSFQVYGTQFFSLLAEKNSRSDKKHYLLKFCRNGSSSTTDTQFFEYIKKEVAVLQKTAAFHAVRGPFEASEKQLCIRLPYKLPNIGRELFDVLADDHDSFGRNLTLQDRVSLTYALFDAVAAQVHQYGIIHRDLKNENILCDKNNLSNLFIIDFGLAKLVGETLPNEMSGAPLYMPPEMCDLRGASSTMKSDSYPLGILLGMIFGWYLSKYHDEALNTDAVILAIIQQKQYKHVLNFVLHFFLAESSAQAFQVGPVFSLIHGLTEFEEENRYTLAEGREVFDRAVKDYESKNQVVLRNEKQTFLLNEAFFTNIETNRKVSRSIKEECIPVSFMQLKRSTSCPSFFAATQGLQGSEQTLSIQPPCFF